MTLLPNLSAPSLSGPPQPLLIRVAVALFWSFVDSASDSASDPPPNAHRPPFSGLSTAQRTHQPPPPLRPLFQKLLRRLRHQTPLERPVPPLVYKASEKPFREAKVLPERHSVTDGYNVTRIWRIGPLLQGGLPPRGWPVEGCNSTAAHYCVDPQPASARMLMTLGCI